MKHRGEIIEKVVRESGIPISIIAKSLKKSRQFVYNIFGNPNVPVDIIVLIGKITHHDFSQEFKDLIVAPKKYKVVPSTETLNEDDQNNDANHWRTKYLEVLEKYNQLLQEVVKKNKRKKTKKG